MQNKLKELEKKYEIEWRQYKIGDFFDVGTGSLLSSNELTLGNIPRISAKSDNNGIIGTFDTKINEQARHFENFISVNFFGTDGGIFYHLYEASVEMKVHVLQPKNFKLNRFTGEYIATTLKPILKGFSYGNQLSSSKLKNNNIMCVLPTQNGKIAFNYMEDFIKTLEAYLTVTGLKDTKLTDKERGTLEKLGGRRLSYESLILKMFWYGKKIYQK